MRLTLDQLREKLLTIDNPSRAVALDIVMAAWNIECGTDCPAETPAPAWYLLLCHINLLYAEQAVRDALALLMGDEKNKATIAKLEVELHHKQTLLDANGRALTGVLGELREAREELDKHTPATAGGKESE